MTTIELREHPARARDPVTNEILTDEQGNTIPAITDTRSIWINGMLAGYYGTKSPCNVMLIREYPDAIKAMVVKHVEQNVGAVKVLTAAPELFADEEGDE